MARCCWTADGSFTYQPVADFVGADSFTYTAGDAAGSSNVATVTIAVAAGCNGHVAATRGATTPATSADGTEAMT